MAKRISGYVVWNCRTAAARYVSGNDGFGPTVTYRVAFVRVGLLVGRNYRSCLVSTSVMVSAGSVVNTSVMVSAGSVVSTSVVVNNFQRGGQRLLARWSTITSVLTIPRRVPWPRWQRWLKDAWRLIVRHLAMNVLTVAALFGAGVWLWRVGGSAAVGTATWFLVPAASVVLAHTYARSDRSVQPEPVLASLVRTLPAMLVLFALVVSAILLLTAFTKTPHNPLSLPQSHSALSVVTNGAWLPAWLYACLPEVGLTIPILVGHGGSCRRAFANTRVAAVLNPQLQIAFFSGMVLSVMPGPVFWIWPALWTLSTALYYAIYRDVFLGLDAVEHIRVRVPTLSLRRGATVLRRTTVGIGRCAGP